MASGSDFVLVQLYAADDSETVDTLIMRLKGMKASSSQRDQDVFRCMIQSLFDEYRFFHKYPEKELQTTAALFGGLINSNLIVDQSLGDALRLFLEAVRNPAGHKMCIFGLQALRTIVDRLPAWPQYCRNLLQVRFPISETSFGAMQGFSSVCSLRCKSDCCHAGCTAQGEGSRAW